jgi:hypothetical protein
MALCWLPLLAAPATGETLMYEATFTTTLDWFRLDFLKPRDFDWRAYPVAELGYEGVPGGGLYGMNVGDRRDGALRIYDTSPDGPDYSDYQADFLDGDDVPRHRLECAFAGPGSNLCADVIFRSGYMRLRFSEDRRSIETLILGDASFAASYYYELTIGPGKGSMGYADDGARGTVDGIEWFAEDSAYRMTFSDVRVSVPAAVPVPATGLLLVGGFAALAALRTRERRSAA